MAFQILGLSYDFHSGNAVANLNKQFVPPSNAFANVMVNFQLKPAPSGGTPDAATEAEIRAEAKQMLLEAAAAL
jgi:hypothetical protein